MAVIVTRLVAHRIGMNAEMEKLQEEMMKHWTQHMPLEFTALSHYPIMNGMNGMNEKSGDAPKEQK